MRKRDRHTEDQPTNHAGKRKNQRTIRHSGFVASYVIRDSVKTSSAIKEFCYNKRGGGEKE